MTSLETAMLDDIDLTDASVWEKAAPHDWLDRLRAEDPVHWHPESDGPGFWALTRHGDVRRVSTSPDEFSSYVGGPLRLDPAGEGGLDQVRMIIIGMDPPEHRSFRAIVSKAFTPKTIARLEESLREETKRVIGQLRNADRCEFVTDVAARIPMWSISELMGVPEADLIDRTPNTQQSFGLGEHFCLGANLARHSLRILFAELFATVENIALEAPPRRLHSNLINGIKEMRIHYDVCS